MGGEEQALRRYRSFVSDNARWDGFPFRPDDIVISTPPKCGTTWTQYLCALLVLGEGPHDRPMAEISPWLDMLLADRDEVVARLEAQTHRRFIKTHTPLDGLPDPEGVTFVCVGRDPRDVALSWEHHMENLDVDAFLAARAAAVGLDDLADQEPPEPPPDDPVERFWRWAEADPADEGVTLPSVLGHLQTFWDRRHDPDVVLLHYADLQADLPAELRRLADALGVDVDDARLAELAAAAGFERMKADADRLAPNTDTGIWKSNADFFHRGGSGRWRVVLGDDPDADARYQARVAALIGPDLAAWAHGGRHAT
jgi:hypothetical protein